MVKAAVERKEAALQEVLGATDEVAKRFMGVYKEENEKKLKGVYTEVKKKRERRAAWKEGELRCVVEREIDLEGNE